jgi:hypothetical protein
MSARPNHTLYFVLFHGDRCPACQSVYPVFISAAKKLKGIAVFAHVDCSRNLRLARNFSIRAIPSFYIFHSKGISSWNSFFKFESSFMGAVASYLPERVSKVNTSWLPGPSQTIRNSVILFTGKWSIPLLWKALAANLTDSRIAFGFVNDRATKRAFNIWEETVVMIRDGELSQMGEVSSFLGLRKAVLEHFENVNVQNDIPAKVGKDSSDL